MHLRAFESPAASNVLARLSITTIQDTFRHFIHMTRGSAIRKLEIIGTRQRGEFNLFKRHLESITSAICLLSHFSNSI